MENSESIIFESRDVEIFSIPDTKTKLNTLQNYFFPRLQRILDMALELVREVYQIDPFEKYTFVRRPSHRKEAKANRDLEEIYIGISGHRDKSQPLTLKRANGKPYIVHPAYLSIKVSPTGEIYAELWPFWHDDNDYLRNVKHFLSDHYNAFSAMLNAGQIYYEGGDEFTTVATRLRDTSISRKLFTDNVRDEDYFSLSSAKHYFPIENQDVILRLVWSFLFMFPVLDVCHDIAEGVTPSFQAHFEKLKTWMTSEEQVRPMAETTLKSEVLLPELDSYKFVRAGLWYQVLARDNWTCKSCRRSAREYGIVLHVDHILPRSRGGKDELNNLQTLCLKCNIGKSNRDDTDLR